MPQYGRKTFRYNCQSLDLCHPVDAMPEGRYPALLNVRVNQQGSITSREPINKVTLAGATDAIHSLRRLNDPVTGTSIRVVGAGTKLYTGLGSLIQRDTGYSGSPLSLLPYRQDQSPQPWMYVGDVTKMSKVRSDGTIRQVGIFPPQVEPTAAFLPFDYATPLDTNSAGGWVAGGTAIGAVSALSRVSATVFAILYDVGTAGWACIVPDTGGSGIQVGTLVSIAGEPVMVHDVFPAIVTTQVAAIMFDGDGTATTGNCTVILSASSAGLRRDALVKITSEYVRVKSVTTGPDGTVSFRCTTTLPHTAGETVTGYMSFRAYTLLTHASPDAIVSVSLTDTMNPGTAYIQKVTGGPYDYSQVNGRPVTVDDWIHVAFMTDRPDLMIEGRIAFNVDPVIDFTKNYYYKTFRPADITPNVNNSLTSVTTLTTAIARSIVDSSTPSSPSSIGAQPQVVQNIIDKYPELAYQLDLPSDGGSGLSTAPADPTVSTQLVPGVQQWTDLWFRVSELVRVGNDNTRSLKDVNGVRVQIVCSGLTGATPDVITFAISNLWVGGTRNLDVGDTGTPMLFAYRYRDSTTGAKSNPSPIMRSGVFPHRERVSVGVTASTNPAVDKIDIFVFGGTVPSWRKAVTVPNATAAFTVDVSSSFLQVAEEMSFIEFQPFPVSDKPRSGTCVAVGTSVRLNSGDFFNSQWSPGSVILLNNVAYTIYSMLDPTNPTSSTPYWLQLNEACPAYAGTFLLPEPTLIGQPLPAIWDGGSRNNNVVFGCGGALNPGWLSWCRSGNPDAASDFDYLEATPPSEPLMNGFTWDGRSYVFSTERLMAILPSTPVGKQTIGFITEDVPLVKGLCGRNFFCIHPLGVVMGTRDGICVWSGGSPVSITDDTLYPLFPHAHEVGNSVNGYLPISFSTPDNLILSTDGQDIYFFYTDTAGIRNCLVFDPAVKGWFPLQFEVQQNVFYSEEPYTLNSVLLGGSDGNLYQYDPSASEDYRCRTQTPFLDLGDSRATKIFTDSILDATGAFTAIAHYDNDTVPPVGIGTVGGGSRNQAVVILDNTDLHLHRNISLDTYWVGGHNSGSLYEFQPNAILEAYLAYTYVTESTSHGMEYAHLRDGYLAVLANDPVTLYAMIDGVQHTLVSVPSTNGLYQRFYFPTPPLKGIAIRYTAACPSLFALFAEDTFLHVKQWGSQSGYQQFRPFAGMLSS